MSVLNIFFFMIYLPIKDSTIATIVAVINPEKT